MASGASNAVRENWAENMEAYHALNVEVQLFPHASTYGTFSSANSDATILSGQLDQDLFDVSNVSDAAFTAVLC